LVGGVYLANTRCIMAVTSKRRVQRELKTVGAMIASYRGGNHGTDHGLCTDCQSLWEYAQQGVERCPVLDDKPTCGNCLVHCYRPVMRERIRRVMRYSGPGML
jgi:hypothetical protein